jgi:glutathione S-transferase
MKLELISFKLCPFVQRSVITLLHQDLPHQVTYIDLADPPDWFRRISPTGKVPLLRVAEKTVLFESAVINEFIDEITPTSLHPADPLRRAVNRAWIEFGSECLFEQYRLTTAASEEDYVAARDGLLARLMKVDEVVSDGPFFNGPDFSLVDAAYAPLFMRLELLNQLHTLFEPQDFPRLSAWSNAVLNLPSVQDSVVPDFPDLYRASLRERGGHAARVFFG